MSNLFFALLRLHRASWHWNVNVWLKTTVSHKELIHLFCFLINIVGHLLNVYTRMLFTRCLHSTELTSSAFGGVKLKCTLCYSNVRNNEFKPSKGKHELTLQLRVVFSFLWLRVFMGGRVCWLLHGLIRGSGGLFVCCVFSPGPCRKDAVLCPDLSVLLWTRLHDPRLMCACWSTKPDETNSKRKHD